MQQQQQPTPESNKVTLDQTVGQVKQLIPLVSVISGALAFYFTLQGQVNDLRTRMDLQTQQIQLALTDIKVELKELRTAQTDVLRRTIDVELESIRQREVKNP